MTNILPAVVQKVSDQYIAHTTIGDFPVRSAREGEAQVLIRPDQAQIGMGGPTVLRGVIRGVSFRGSRQRVALQVGEWSLSFDFPSAIMIQEPGAQVEVSLDPLVSIKVFPGNQD